MAYIPQEKVRVMREESRAQLATEFESDVDYAKVGRIEAAARTVGVTVYWFNHPIKSSATN